MLPILSFLTTRDVSFSLHFHPHFGLTPKLRESSLKLPKGLCDVFVAPNKLNWATADLTVASRNVLPVIEWKATLWF